jgi:hypothetical protein
MTDLDKNIQSSSVVIYGFGGDKEKRRNKIAEMENVRLDMHG